MNAGRKENEGRPRLGAVLFAAVCAVVFAEFFYFRTLALNYPENTLHHAACNQVLGGMEKTTVWKRHVRDFIDKGEVYSPSVDQCLPEFEAGIEIIGNKDFSSNRRHWVTTGTDERLPLPSANEFNITEEAFVSPPAALKVTAREYPCRLFYCRDPEKTFIAFPWDFSKSPEVWLPVSPGKIISLSFFYKGASPVIYLNLVERSGKTGVLKRAALEGFRREWQPVSLSAKVPDFGRAVCLEILVNSDRPGEEMFIDDVSLEVSDQ